MKRPHEADIPKELFNYTPPKKETIISRAEFMALRNAAIAKNRLANFRAWLEARKIKITA